MRHSGPESGAFPVISNVLWLVAPGIRIGDDVVCRFRYYPLFRIVRQTRGNLI